MINFLITLNTSKNPSRLLCFCKFSVSGISEQDIFYIKPPLGFLCVAAFYLLLLIIVYMRKKAWIERPLVKFLATILLEEV